VSKFPDWVRPKALIRHKPQNVLFFCEHRIRRSLRLYLLDAPRGQQATEYLLEECEPANHLTHLNSVAIVSFGGTLISVIRDGATLTLTTDGRKVEVRCNPKWWVDPDLQQATESFARAFSGAIASEVS
jgi:hypothetical protein